MSLLPNSVEVPIGNFMRQVIARSLQTHVRDSRFNKNGFLIACWKFGVEAEVLSILFAAI